MDRSGQVDAGWCGGRKPSGVLVRPSSHNSGAARSRSDGNEKIMLKPRQLLCLVMATVVAFSSLGEARDTSTVSAGYQHTCVVTNDANVKCFGYGKNGELGLGDDDNRGDGDGGMGDDLPNVDLGTGASATAVSAAWEHSCALLEGGDVKCWGRNNHGQLGQGDYVDRGDDPSTMGANLTAIDLGSSPSGNGTAVAIGISAGQQFTCVLVEGGAVKCFGRNDEGQLGRGNLDTNVGSNAEDMGDSLPYVNLGSGVEAVAISSGASSTCAALLGGGIKCWGGNAYGGLGVGDTYNVGDETEDMGDGMLEVDLGTGEVGSSVVCGLRHACAILAGGNVKCWGDNRSGQLGQGHVATLGDDADEMGDALPYVDLGTGRTANSLTLGESHSCAILDDGSVRCWGKSFAGQLGRGEYYARGKYPGEMGASLTAVDLGANATASTLVAGSDHTCATLTDGSLKCWGRNALGALGLGDTLDRGDDDDEMGDALPAVSLGTGVTVAEDTEVIPVATLSPSPAPSPASTPSPTPEATEPPTDEPSSPAPTDAEDSSPQPTPGSADATPEPATPEPATPEPATPAPTQEDGSRGVEDIDTAGGAGEDSSITSSNVALATFIAAPLLGLALLLCFCARRRRGDRHRDGEIPPNESWIKDRGSGGATVAGVGAGGASSADSTHNRTKSGNMKVLPAGSEVSTSSGAPNRRDNVDQMNLAEDLVVGGGVSRGRSESGSRRHKRGGSNSRNVARCGSDTAFSMTSQDDHPNSVASRGRGGDGSDSSRDAGTGQSMSPQGYNVEDDDAESAFHTVVHGHPAGRSRRRSSGSGDVDDDLSENGWAPRRMASHSEARSQDSSERDYEYA